MKRFISYNLLTSLLVTLGLIGVPEAVKAANPQTEQVLTWSQVAPEDRSNPVSEGIEISQLDDQAVYEDPAGRFSVPIPTKWTVENRDNVGILTSPDWEIVVYVLAIGGENVEDAIRDAWKQVDPEFDSTSYDSPWITDFPSEGIDQTVSIFYNTDENETAIAYGVLSQGVIYITLGRGDSDSWERRISQLQIIDTGFTITALEPVDQVDLMGIAPLPLTDELKSKFEAYIREGMELLNIPGASVAVVQDDQIVYAQGFGVREYGKDAPVTPETLMMVGSVTKSMTTMFMATVVDDGLMDWDTPVVDILPTFTVSDPELTPQITMRHLVCACSGIPRQDFEILFNFNELTAEDVIESVANFEFFTSLGEAFQYSNQMVAVGGYVTALAAGGEYGNLYDSYVALMQERILTPIGMTHSTFSLEEVEKSDNYALPHNNSFWEETAPLSLSAEKFFLPVAPAGGLWSNVLDMGRYLITELNAGIAPDGKRVVSAENLAETWKPEVRITAESSYGLAWFVDNYKGLRLLDHNGNTSGFTAELAFLPDADLGVVVLTNASQTNLFNEAIRLHLFELLFQQDSEEDLLASFRTPSEPYEDWQTAIAPYLGRYSNEALGKVTVEWQEDTLILDAGEFETELDLVSNEEETIWTYPRDFGLAGTEIRLSHDEVGKPILIFNSGSTEYIFERLSR